MKFHYKVYEYYPGATKISHFREELKVSLIRIALIVLGIGLVLWFFLPILGGVVLALGALLMIYLLTIYSIQTKKEIRQDQEAMDAMRKLTKGSSAVWVELIRENGEGKGRCMRCLQEHVHCENHEVWFKGHRWSIPICKECRDLLATFVRKNPLF